MSLTVHAYVEVASQVADYTGNIIQNSTATLWVVTLLELYRVKSSIV